LIGCLIRVAVLSNAARAVGETVFTTELAVLFVRAQISDIAPGKSQSFSGPTFQIFQLAFVIELLFNYLNYRYIILYFFIYVK